MQTPIQPQMPMNMQMQMQRGIHITPTNVARAKELVAAAQVGYIEPGFPDLERATELLACNEAMADQSVLSYCGRGSF